MKDRYDPSVWVEKLVNSRILVAIFQEDTAAGLVDLLRPDVVVKEGRTIPASGYDSIRVHSASAVTGAATSINLERST